MSKLYTALGQYKLTTDDTGRGIPTVYRKGQEYCLDICEMVIWSTLLWNIETQSSLEQLFVLKIKEAGVQNPTDFNACLNRLEQRGLIIFGEGIDVEGSLYNLLADLYIVPLKISLFAKTATFFYLLFRGRPFSLSAKSFRSTELNSDEKKLLYLSRQLPLTVADIIMRFDRDSGLQYLQTPRGYQRKTLCAITNLYLKKEIILQ